LTSSKNAYEALQDQLQMFLKLSELGVESLKTNPIAQPSIDTTETTTIIRDQCK